MPEVALGAKPRDRDGFRKSQSTRMTRPPAWAMSCASEAAIVVFPSFGRAEVMPTTVWGEFVALKSIASFTERIDSAKRDNGASTTDQKTPGPRTSVLLINPSSLSFASLVACFG